MEASAWSWTYGRSVAMVGARASGAACGGRMVVALLEAEASRRLKRVGGSLAERVRVVRQRVDAVAATLSDVRAGGGNAHAVAAAAEEEEPAPGEWCDLRSVQQWPWRTASADVDGDEAAALGAKLELWRRLASTLARHEEALVFSVEESCS